MQEIITGIALDEMKGLDDSLQRGTDRLLRVIATGALENINTVARPYDYSTEHLKGVYANFSDYFEKKRGGTRTFTADENEWTDLTADMIISILHGELENYTAHRTDLNRIEIAQLRLCFELAGYLIDVRKARAYLDIPVSVMLEFQALIEPYFKKRFGIFIPGRQTAQDLAELEEIKKLCNYFWEDWEM